MLDRAAVRRRTVVDSAETSTPGESERARISALVFAFRYFYYLKKDLEKVSDKTRTRAFARSFDESRISRIDVDIHIDHRMRRASLKYFAPILRYFSHDAPAELVYLNNCNGKIMTS